MTLTFYWYPKCSTCQKAKKWLDTHDISYDLVHIVDETPTKEEILHMIENSGLPARRFFNTSGRVYRSLNMKDKIKDASVDEMAAYLASDGMLIKRPIATDGHQTTVGFKEDMFQDVWLRA